MLSPLIFSVYINLLNTRFHMFIIFYIYYIFMYPEITFTFQGMPSLSITPAFNKLVDGIKIQNKNKSKNPQ